MSAQKSLSVVTGRNWEGWILDIKEVKFAKHVAQQANVGSIAIPHMILQHSNNIQQWTNEQEPPNEPVSQNTNQTHLSAYKNKNKAYETKVT